MPLLPALAALFGPVAPVMVARLAASTLAAALLYRALRDERGDDSVEPEAAHPAWADLLRRAFFAVLGGVMFFILSARWVPGDPYREAGRGFKAYSDGVLSFHVEHTHVSGLMSA